METSGEIERSRWEAKEAHDEDEEAQGKDGAARWEDGVRHGEIDGTNGEAGGTCGEGEGTPRETGGVVAGANVGATEGEGFCGVHEGSSGKEANGGSFAADVKLEGGNTNG